jgi:hypothetical protein
MPTVVIRIRGHLGAEWSEWLGGLSIACEGDESVLTGPIADQSELYGLLSRLRDLGLVLISVDWQEEEQAE